MNFYERKAVRSAYYHSKVKGWKLQYCGACSASGRYRDTYCSNCDGTGKTRVKLVRWEDSFTSFCVDLPFGVFQHYESGDWKNGLTYDITGVEYELEPWPTSVLFDFILGIIDTTNKCPWDYGNDNHASIEITMYDVGSMIDVFSPNLQMTTITDEIDLRRLMLSGYNTEDSLYDNWLSSQ